MSSNGVLTQHLGPDRPQIEFSVSNQNWKFVSKNTRVEGLVLDEDSEREEVDGECRKVFQCLFRVGSGFC